jgi:hypothetical protein
VKAFRIVIKAFPPKSGFLIDLNVAGGLREKNINLFWPRDKAIVSHCRFFAARGGRGEGGIGLCRIGDSCLDYGFYLC